jgi:hypothetical protein
MWIEEKVPMDWTTDITVTITKNKGDKLQCHNYRGRQGLEQENQLRTKFLQLEKSQGIQHRHIAHLH